MVFFFFARTGFVSHAFLSFLFSFSFLILLLILLAFQIETMSISISQRDEISRDSVLPDGEVNKDVVLYYSNLRHHLVSVSKPPSRPLKLKVSSKEFRVSHKLEKTEQMEDILDDMRPSFWPKKEKRKGFNRPAYQPATQSIAESENEADAEREEYIGKLKRTLNEIPINNSALSFLTKKQQSAKPKVTADVNEFNIVRGAKKETSKEVVRGFVRAWVENGDGDHIPEVQIESGGRTWLSQQERGNFRMEKPPRPPFILPTPESPIDRRKTLATQQKRQRDAGPLLFPRPNSAPARRRSSLMSSDAQSIEIPQKPTALAKYLEKLKSEPIRSYKVFYNATVTPPPKKKKNAPLIADSTYYRDNLEIQEHHFDHMRLKKQVEIDEFVEWRGKCRGVVSAKLSENVQKTPLQEQQLKVFGSDPYHFLYDSLESKKNGLQSAWITKAMHLAVEDERKKICKKISEFKLDFVAATLSKEAMESLRKEVLVKIRTTPCIDEDNALFSKKDFIKFLARRTKSSEHKFSMISSTDRVDVIDAMRSPAEAAFAKYVFSVLPT